eukprot:CAMPEP_0178697964 /NCGR_PEP_ID=MMETSP0699-20121125/10274_1 /TAXON_ID=265572 /ORGANISM="Extubocellulus spinifer, Strain CCMP396" /LENGTH=285 /DNA_ID=CAMNT_0020343973 /DNA_START=240 /DNA_END=1098 /DNA_ORIENTATION=+
MEAELEKSRRQKKIEELILTKKRVSLWGELRDDDISVVASALARSTTLKVLHLGGNGNGVGDAEVKLIADALQSNTSCELSTLYLNNNNIGPDGAKYLSEALCHSNYKLLTLWLNRNNIGDNGAKYLAEALCHSNCKLQELLLGNNNICDDGVKNLAEALCRSNCRLIILYVNNNNIGDAGAALFADMLRYDNRTLMELDLSGNPDIPPALRRKIDRLAEINSESINCTAVEVGRKKWAEYGPTVDELYGFAGHSVIDLMTAFAVKTSHAHAIPSYEYEVGRKKR